MAGRLSAQLVRGAALIAFAGLVAVGLTKSPAAKGAAAEQSQTGGIIVGRVVEADSESPLPGAIVQLDVTPRPPAASPAAGVPNGVTTAQTRGAAPPQTSGAVLQPSPLRVLADRDGRFVFRDVPAGTCRLSVDAQDYFGGGYHQQEPDGSAQVLDLADGQSVRDVVLKMWKEAAITGRVVDESGEPVVGVSVHALRSSVVNGATTWQSVWGLMETDDRGVYRAYHLRPGDYVVEVVPTIPATVPMATETGPLQAGAPSGQVVGDLRLFSTGGGNAPVTPGAANDGVRSAYVRTFYPGSTDLTRATVLTLHSGEERPGVDIQFTLMPAFRISGVLADPDGHPVPNALLRLTALADQGDAGGVPAAMATTDSRGAFTFLAVPRGDYVVVGQRSAGGRGAAGAPSGADAAPTLWARAPVSLADKDVSGLALALRAGLKVTGHVVFEGTSPRPSGGQLARGILLQPTGPGMEGAGYPAAVAQINPDGSFATRGSTPGRYMIVASGWPGLKWIAKSISADGRDVSDLPIDLDASDLSNVVVTFTDRPAALTGTVRRPTRDPDPTAFVVGFPVDPRAWGSPGIHTFTAHATTSGAYTVPSIAPGDYNVAAIPDTLAQTWRDPNVLPRIAGSAVRVHVEAGAQATQDLTASTIR